MFYSVSATIDAPVIRVHTNPDCRGNGEITFTLPRVIMDDIARVALRDIVHNGTDDQRAAAIEMAQEILAIFAVGTVTAPAP